MTRTEIISRLFKVTPADFEDLALNIFQYQYAHVPIYKQWCDAFQRNPTTVQNLIEIPFLPIQFFKSHVVSSANQHQAVFRSSGTTKTQTAQHFVAYLHIYEQSYLQYFETLFGAAKNWCFIGLLPSYLERDDASLVHMVQGLINESDIPQSGFYLNANEQLIDTLKILKEHQTPTMLFGVTFALLDLIDLHNIDLSDSLIKVMQTGGMKGRGKELIAEDLYHQLEKGLNTSRIYSEYGMTELFSQAYDVETPHLYQPPNWMRVFTRPLDAPTELNTEPKRGVLNVMDLANIDSCSFIATDDQGELLPDGRFKVLGRIDHSDIRGCSQMTA